MYERHFQLRERPFALSPDPDYLYPSKVHQEALSYLRYGVEGHAGFVVITGEIGSGKTTLLQALLGQLDRNTAVSRIVNTLLDPRELLEAIMLDFGLDPTGLSKPVLLRRLADFLVQQRLAGRLTLLVIDEAQNLCLPALEEIRMLSNLETEKSKLIQIVLMGQPELRQTLALPQLEQLRQRVTVSYHLHPLDAADTARYVNHRLRRAAIGAPLEFPPDVTALIHRRSRGVPRIINVIADATLLFAYGVDRRDIDLAITRDALEELDATGVLAVQPLDPPAAGNVGRPVEGEAPAEAPAESVRDLTSVSLPRATPDVPSPDPPSPRAVSPEPVAVAAPRAFERLVPITPTVPRLSPLRSPGVSAPLGTRHTAASLTSASHPSARPLGLSVGARYPDDARPDGVSPTFRVQRLTASDPSASSGFWTRLRRRLFGMPEAGV